MNSVLRERYLGLMRLKLADATRRLLSVQVTAGDSPAGYFQIVAAAKALEAAEELR